MSAKIIFISMFAAVLVVFLILLNYPRIPSAFVCTAKIHVFLQTQKEGVSIEGEVLLVFRVSSAKEGAFSQVGVLDVNGKSYAVNRSTTLSFLGQDSDGYLRTQRIAVVKNDNDDLPDEITNLLMSKQQLFYYKIIHVSDNVYGVEDLRRTLMVCRAR